MKYTQIPSDIADALAVNAGILLSEFDPTTATVDNTKIIGATTGGVTCTLVPTFSDFGEDIDNCPKNTKELKRIESYEAKMSGTFLSMNTAVAKSVIGCADIGLTDTTNVVPRATLAQSDFADIWYVCDYSSKNSSASGGYVAIKLINALSTGGFSIKSTDKGKGQFAFEYTGHTSTTNIEEVPMDFFIKVGTV